MKVVTTNGGYEIGALQKAAVNSHAKIGADNIAENLWGARVKNPHHTADGENGLKQSARLIKSLKCWDAYNKEIGDVPVLIDADTDDNEDDEQIPDLVDCYGKVKSFKDDTDSYSGAPRTKMGRDAPAGIYKKLTGDLKTCLLYTSDAADE